ncbi:MAG: CvpA family protein [Parcubacteria group bacterium]|nr:CvpA family protein [Parcubacteria group bacterium]
MTIYDLILLLIVFGFVWFNFWYGLVKSIGGIIGVILGAILASRWYGPLAQKAMFAFGGNEGLAKAIVFILLLIVLWRLIALVFVVLDKFLDILSFIPFLQTFNRLGGAVLGIVEGGLLVGLVLLFVDKWNILPFVANVVNSEVGQFLIKIGRFLAPLLPKDLKSTGFEPPSD